MRTCDETLELISAALDGALSDRDRAELDEHLSQCPACSALFEELRELHDQTAALEDVSAPAGFTGRVMDAIAADPAQERPENVIPFPAKKRSRAPWKGWAATAAVVAVVALGALTLPGQLKTADQASSSDCAAPAAGMAENGSVSPGSDAGGAYRSADGKETAEAPEEALEKNILTAQSDQASLTAPASAPEELHAARAEEILAGMTLHEKICQLFIVDPETLTGASPVLTADAALEQALDAWPVGGLLLDKSNLQSSAQVSDLLSGAQAMSEIPLLLTCDEEGGRVNRLMSTVGTTYVGPMLDYKDAGTQTALENAQTIAADLACFGFNLDLAPVADVWSNTDNTVIGDRAYSDDFAQAADLVAAAVEGFHTGGVACTLKHFPGHGDTSADSHDGAVYVDKTLDELRENELLPFQAGIDAGADAVMIGHLIVSDVDSQPAPFSYKIVTELLRQEMGFTGVVMTDSLQMKAVTGSYTSGEIAVKAVQAGVDLLLCPQDLEEAVTALETAVETGEIPSARIDESVRRILELKLRQGILA